MLARSRASAFRSPFRSSRGLTNEARSATDHHWLEASRERKLTALLSAEVKGYSRLMGEDEAAIIRTLTAYRQVMTSLLEPHRGTVVDSPRHVGISQSLLASCRLLGVDPYVYLVDVFQRIDTHPAFDVHLLTPHLWKQHFVENPLRADLARCRQ